MKLGRIIAKSRKKLMKLVKFSKKILDKDDLDALKSFLPDIVVYGPMINFGLFVIANFPFTWYSWIGWGFALKIMEKKILPWIRSVVNNK